MKGLELNLTIVSWLSLGQGPKSTLCCHSS